MTTLDDAEDVIEAVEDAGYEVREFNLATYEGEPVFGLDLHIDPSSSDGGE